MPDETFEATGPEIEPGVLLDSRSMQSRLSIYVERLYQFWQSNYRNKHGRLPRLPSTKDLEEICHILRPEVRTALTLGSSLNNLNQQLVELSEEQAKVVRGLRNNPRSLIEGGAGTGKTIIAIDRALKLADEGNKVLYLCFNKLLGQHVAEHLQRQSVRNGSISAHSIYSFYRSAIADACLECRLDNWQGAEDELFSRLYPMVYAESIVELGREALYDVVIVDEAQDLMTHEHLDALDLTLKGGLDGGRWQFFLDPNQNIFGKSAEGPRKRLQDYGCASFELTINCRNTRSVALTTAIVYSIDISLEGTVQGGYREVVFYKDLAEFQRHLNRLVDRLLQGGLTRSDMIVLSTKTYDKSSISRVDRIAGQPIRDISKDQSRRQSVDFCTMQAFKGLERKAVIAVDVNDLETQTACLLHYCGLSRARTWLAVILPEEAKPAYEQRTRDFGFRLSEA